MYYKKVDLTSNKAMFEFLTNHFTYDTMNSWNGLRSIANNVKVYNIPDLDDREALEALEDDDYFSINEAIKDWEDDHPGYKVGFNGRSGGYLVLYSSDHNGHCFKGESCSPCHYKTYDEWRSAVKDGWGSLKAFHPTLIKEVKLVQEFDQLCDDLVALTKSLIEDMKRRKALTKSYSATLRFQRYHYDTVEDMKLHMLDMKRRGYSVWEYSDSDSDGIYAEYEMNESIESEITLDEEGDEEFVC